MPKETLTDVFARADLGSRVVALLKRDPDFGSLNLNYAPGAGDQDLVLHEFLERAHAPALEKPWLARWILAQYLTHRHNGQPILIEDLYKIGDNIKYFDALKTQPVFKGEKDLTRYTSYADLEAAITPHREARAGKEESFRLRHIPAEVRAETTVLYENANDGFVVIPHTVAASKFWGKNTQWCVSGDKDAEESFPRYNRLSPIAMIIPAETPWKKMALADRAIFNSQDEKVSSLPEAHAALLAKASAALSLPAAAALNEMVETAKTLEEKIRQSPSLRSILRPTAAEDDSAVILPTDTDPLWNDRDMVLELFLKSSYFIITAPPHVQCNRNLMLDLIERKHVLYQVAKQNDARFQEDALNRNGAIVASLATSIQHLQSIVGRALRETNDLPFSFLIPLKKYDLSWCGLSDKELNTHQRAALNRLADAGDMKRLKRGLRVMKEFWGNAEMILAPTVEGVRAVLAAKRPVVQKNKMKVGVS